MMLSDEILDRAQAWVDDARAEGSMLEPTAMNLATVGADGQPHSRIVLLKGLDERGFVFYTNLGSDKAHELEQNPRAALCFHWMPLKRQLRIEGAVQKVTDAEADAYFASRARESRIGAWASHQSQPLADRAQLQRSIDDYTKRFAGVEVPRPDFWSGWRVLPARVEFWHEGDFRLHQRDVFVRQGDVWTHQNLYP